MALTAKQRAFVSEYLIDLNATAAAKRAGYSQKTADRIGPQLLGKTCVAAAIQEALTNREKRTAITQDYVLRRLREEADLEGEGSQHSSRIKALELLGKHLGMFTDKFSLQGSMEVRYGTDPELEKLLKDPEAQGLLAELYARKASGGVANAGKE